MILFPLFTSIFNTHVSNVRCDLCVYVCARSSLARTLHHTIENDAVEHWRELREEQTGFVFFYFAFSFDINICSSATATTTNADAYVYREIIWWEFLYLILFW